ncbi:MAG: hypothetical protein SGCHY_004104 [Lobulomycetales sp.]
MGAEHGHGGLGAELECSVSEELENYDLPLHIASVFILLIVSLLGAMSPIIYALFGKKDLAKQSYNSTPKFLLRLCLFFGAGIILSTGFVHMLIHGFFLLNNPCLNEAFHDGYPAFAAFFAMLAVLLMQLLQYGLSSYYMRRHSHEGLGSSPDDDDTKTVALEVSQKKSNQIGVFLLESGIAIHSVIVGFAVGIATDSDFIALLIAISFHQFFEGVALGSTVVDAQFSSKLKGVFSALLYGISTPLGVIIAIGVRSSYKENSPAALLTQGILESLSGGMLIYTALVEFLTPQITNSLPFRQQSLGRQAAQFAALYLGVAIMSILGHWA